MSHIISIPIVNESDDLTVKIVATYTTVFSQAVSAQYPLTVVLLVALERFSKHRDHEKLMQDLGIDLMSRDILRQESEKHERKEV